VFSGTTEQQPEELHTSPDVKTTSGTAEGVPPLTDVDSELSSPSSETIQASTPADKPTPNISYDTVEGEPRTTTSETENQETSDDGRTITRRVKTIRYYQPVVSRTLADGVVIKETSEDVLVGSYVDEYCFDAPLDLEDVYSASVETQTSVDETEQTLDDGTWLRRKVTRVVAYLAVDEEEETESICEPKLPAKISQNLPADLKHADQPDHETKPDTEVQRTTETKDVPVKPASITTVDDSVTKETSESRTDVGEVEVTPVSEELIMAVPNPRQERARPVMMPEPITSSFDYPEELIEECPTVEQFAAPQCEFNPVEEDVIAPSIRSPRESIKDVPDFTHGEPTRETPLQPGLAKQMSDTKTAGGTESKEVATAAVVELASEQVIVESVEKSVDVGSQLETEYVQHAHLESDFHSVPATKQSTDSGDLTCKVEPSSVVIDAEPEYETDHALVISRDEQIAAETTAPSESSATTETKHVPARSTESPKELMSVSEELITAVPSARVRPTMTTAPMTSSFDEPEDFPPGEQVIEEQPTFEQFAVPRCDLEPVSEETITPNLRPSKESAAVHTTKLDSVIEDTTYALGSAHESKKIEQTGEYCVVMPATTTKVDDSVTKETTDSRTDVGELEVTPVSEELIMAVPNPRQERARPVMTPEPITSSFDEPEELIEECPAVEQFAAPQSEFKPVEEDIIAPSIRSPGESIKDVPDFIHGEPTTETSHQPGLAKQMSDTTTLEQVPVSDSMKITSDSKDSTKETVPVMEELITAVPSQRQESVPRPIAIVPVTSSFDEPEELLLPDEQLIEEQMTGKQAVCDLKPAEEELITEDIRPPRASSRDTAILDNGTTVPTAVERTPFVPVEKINATSEAIQFQSPSIDSKAATTIDQPRTRPVLVLKSDSYPKTGPGASTFVPTLPPLSSSRQPRRPRSATEMTSRRYGMESPQYGIYSKHARIRRESPLSFVDRLAYPVSPIPLGVEDFDSPLFDDGCHQVRTRSKKLITRKVRKVRHDGEVVEDIVTEEVPDFGYSDTSSVRSGQSPAVLSPRTLSASSITSPLPVEPASPGGGSLSSQSSLRVFTDTVEGEPEVVTDVQEREETLPDGRVVVRKIIRTRQKQTIVKRTVMEGPLADDEQPIESSGQLVAAGEDIQKPDIRTYSDAMDMRPSTDTVSNDVEEVLPDGTVQRKLTTTTSTRQLKTERTVVEGPYVPETVNQALQGDVQHPDKTAMLSQLMSSSSASRSASTTTKTGGPSRTSPRPKFRISMESPPPPPAGAESVGAVPLKMTESSHPAGRPRSQDDQS